MHKIIIIIFLFIAGCTTVPSGLKQDKAGLAPPGGEIIERFPVLDSSGVETGFKEIFAKTVKNPDGTTAKVTGYNLFTDIKGELKLVHTHQKASHLHEKKVYTTRTDTDGNLILDKEGKQILDLVPHNTLKEVESDIQYSYNAQGLLKEAGGTSHIKLFKENKDLKTLSGEGKGKQEYDIVNKQALLTESYEVMAYYSDKFHTVKMDSKGNTIYDKEGRPVTELVKDASERQVETWLHYTYDNTANLKKVQGETKTNVFKIIDDTKTVTALGYGTNFYDIIDNQVSLESIHEVMVYDNPKYYSLGKLVKNPKLSVVTTDTKYVRNEQGRLIEKKQVTTKVEEDRNKYPLLN